jgi:hypothetical protein
VRPMGVVVLEIHPKDLRQMATSYNQPVQALGADRPHPAAGELGVPVAEQEVQASSSLFQDQQEVAGLLGDPGAVGVAVTPAR